ncbi:MAG: tRNA preQ1(34) S-adenosylmethionine ribosyltransferase-isomerase QueA [Syntrophomonadaceae bacterium]|nr:tRNA preQ1(34) S-adenosylmethionine ribosyltransferase-isomerase QueA [Syntrophomonadaceae bacterium]MDD3890208.1 tRNA preQ1(34) S-adenosylmethionine ribosyltransferase-isomerase QueA [Syntrophomonadaceae bacterium]
MLINTSSDARIFNIDTYKFDLPQELIAQYPVEPRDSARLLVLSRRNETREDRVFSDIIDYFERGDTLVLNDTRVIPARIYACKTTGGQVEILLLKRINDGKWEALVRPARRLKPGTIIRLVEDTNVEIEIGEELDFAGGRLVKFINCPDEEELIFRVGHMPLPPYINRADEKEDISSYQTVYARETGSAAAPTAGLHFTKELLNKLQEKGINVATVLLHVGLGTFRPVSSQDIRQHNMHYEYYKMDSNTATLLNQTRSAGKNIIAVGTTVVRTLETVYNVDCGFKASEGKTNKFIYPGYKLKAIDELVTNFHLPGSSLIMLVAAFAGLDNTMAAYNYAVNNRYRFFSYGDAMLIK